MGIDERGLPAHGAENLAGRALPTTTCKPFGRQHNGGPEVRRSEENILLIGFAARPVS